jgi:Fe-S-cluster containining protein
VTTDENATDRPLLRKEILFLRDDKGELEALGDPVIDRRVNLGPLSRVIVPLVDGRASTAEILERAAALLPGADRPALERTFRTLHLLNLLEGSGSEILARVKRTRESGPGPALIPEGSRFACQGSGGCCHHYALGPLNEDDRTRLAGLDIAGAFPGAGNGPFVEQLKMKTGEMEWFLKKTGDHCVFLLSDERCGIHAKFGEAAKPSICQLYPYRALATIDGLKVYDSGECASFAVSSFTGPFLQDRLEHLLGLLPKRPEIHHPVIFLSKETPCDFGHFLAIQKAATELVRTHRGTAPETFLAASRFVREACLALASCPLVRGEPDATLAAFLARKVETVETPPERPSERALRLVARVAEELVASLMSAIVQASGARSPSLEPQFAALAKIVEALALEAADARHGIVEDWKELAAIPANAPEVHDALRLSLRTGLFGDRVVAQDRIAPGVLRLGFVQLLAVAGGKLKARLDRSATVRAVDLSFGHKVAARVLRGGFTTKVFLAHEDDAWEIAEAAAWLLGRLCSPSAS